MSKRNAWAVALLFACILFLSEHATIAVASQDIRVDLIEVHSGDSIQVRYKTSGSVQTVRLFGIRCPQPGEPFGDEARDFLRQAIGEKELLLGRYVDDGSFGEPVALALHRTVYVTRPTGVTMGGIEGHSVEQLEFEVFQEELLKAGLAETNADICRERGYDLFCGTFKELQQQARKEARGMWAAGGRPDGGKRQGQ